MGVIELECIIKGAKMQRVLVSSSQHGAWQLPSNLVIMLGIILKLRKNYLY